MNLEVEQAFLKEICEHPEDDAPRLIFADWLEEWGDQDRAEFIRTQCVLDRLPSTHPRRAVLHKRERELFCRRHLDWESPFRDLGAEKVEFRRGLPDSVTMDVSTFLTSVAKLAHVSQITRLILLRVNARTGNQLAECPEMSHIRELTLSGDHAHGLWDEGVAAIASSPYFVNLSALALPNNNLGAKGVVGLVASPYINKLETLDLSRNAIGVEGYRIIGESKNMKHLKEMSLRRTTSTHLLDYDPVEEDVLIELVRSLPQLHRIERDDDRLSRRGHRALEYLIGRRTARRQDL